jgi:hypothetical protein
LPDHLGAGPGLPSNTGRIGIAPAYRGSDFPKPSFGTIRQPAIGFDLHLIGHCARQKIAPQRFWRGITEQRFPARPQVVEAEIRQTCDLGLERILFGLL